MPSQSPKPNYEEERVEDLYNHQILDTDFEEDYNEIAEMASQICNVPISLISLLDNNRQWFKANKGLSVRETPREYAFCNHAIRQKDQLFEVPDALQDSRFSENPMVLNDPNIRFYAGVPLVSQTGNPLGTLCVIDRQPRSLSATQRKHLSILAKQVSNMLELRQKNIELDLLNRNLNQKNKKLNEVLDLKSRDLFQISSELNTLLYQSSHDLARPIARLLGLTNLAKTLINTEESNPLNDLMETTVKDMQNLVTKFQQIHQIFLPAPKHETISCLAQEGAVLESKQMVLKRFPRAQVNVICDYAKGLTFRIDLEFWQIILANLLENAWMFRKRQGKSACNVHIKVVPHGNRVLVKLHDTGMGIRPEVLDRVKEMFFRGSEASTGNGLGLYVANKAVQAMGGEMAVESEYGSSTTVNLLL